MTPEQQKALNQLVSVLVGSKTAKATNHLIEEPEKRLEECLKVTLADLSTAALMGSSQEQKQATRKLESLQSLQTLAQGLDM
jgi:hypothetical protein